MLIPISDMNILKSASEVRSISETALIDQQIAEVAYVINTAANSGEKRCIFCRNLLDKTIEELENKGYTITKLDNLSAIQYTITF